eukprot:7186051-Lingulodinium_polyedra.AAC.1
MLKSGGHVRWVDHAAMAIDPMTKYGGNWEAMQRMMATAEYGLVEESARLALRKGDDAMKNRVHGRLNQNQIDDMRARLSQRLHQHGV